MNQTPPFTTRFMVQTRSVAKKIESKAHTDDGALKQEATTVDPTPGNGAPPIVKKRRREDVAPPKKRRRGKPSELCQLNLDVLFLVRGCSFIYTFVRLFADLRNGTRLPHTSTLLIS